MAALRIVRPHLHGGLEVFTVKAVDQAGLAHARSADENGGEARRQQSAEPAEPQPGPRAHIQNFGRMGQGTGLGVAFRHMFVQVEAPRFIVLEAIEQGDAAFLAWEFRFRMRRFDTKTEQVIRGSTHIRFDADARVAYHRDYWDAAEELYEKLPVLGGLMRFLKRQAG